MYAAYLNLDNKHPVMALHEYCTARQWDPPFFHLTEKPSGNKKQKLFTAAVSLAEARGACDRKSGWLLCRRVQSVCELVERLTIRVDSS